MSSRSVSMGDEKDGIPASGNRPKRSYASAAWADQPLSIRRGHAQSLRDTGLAMSQESTTPDLVELARRAFQPTASRDIGGVMSFYRPDAVFDLSAGGLGVFRGRTAIQEFMEDWFRPYDRIATDLEAVVQLGSGVTCTVVTQKGRLADGGGEVAVHYAVVNVWVDGLIERSVNYTDIDEARAAAERLAEERG
jgi:ketosteroid isomerase-like protein